jgi:hypothetical protein
VGEGALAVPCVERLGETLEVPSAEPGNVAEDRLEVVGPLADPLGDPHDVTPGKPSV